MLNYMIYLFFGEKVLDVFERNKKVFTDTQRDQFRMGIYFSHFNYNGYTIYKNNEDELNCQTKFDEFIKIHGSDLKQPYYIGAAAHLFLNFIYESEFLVRYASFIDEKQTIINLKKKAKFVYLKKQNKNVSIKEFFTEKYLYGDFSKMTIYIIQKYYMKPIMYAEVINMMDEYKKSNSLLVTATLENFVRKAAIPESSMSVFEKDDFCTFLLESTERFYEWYYNAYE